jgi:leucyl aminopeptidase (aminopeptidase T)
MAEFLLAMAVERAHKKHVKATALIQHGDFIEELVKAATEVGATLVVMGRPDDYEAADALAAKIEELALQTGISFTIAS